MVRGSPGAPRESHPTTEAGAQAPCAGPLAPEVSVLSPLRLATTVRVLLAVLVFCLAIPAPASAQQPPTLLLGAILESNYSIQPGLQVSYSNVALLGGRPRVSLAYSTTRLATARGSNSLVEDRLQAGAAWHFRTSRTVSPSVGLQAGYTRFDRDDEEIFDLLDGGAAIVSALVGVEAKLLPRIRVHGNVGYSALHSSTVYPLVMTAGVHYHLNHPRR